MFVSEIVGLLVFTVAVSAQSMAPGPGHCCLPKKYSATMMESGGSVDLSTGMGKSVQSLLYLNYDYDRRMNAMIMESMDEKTGMMMNTTIIQAYNMSKEYIIVAGGACYTQYIDPSLMSDPCGDMNGKFVYSGQFSIGSPMNRIMLTEASGPYGTYNMSITMTQADCIPVTQTMVGNDVNQKSSGFYAFLYTDVQVGVVDEMLFNIPSSCSSPVSVPIGKRSLRSHFGLRLPF